MGIYVIEVCITQESVSLKSGLLYTTRITWLLRNAAGQVEKLGLWLKHSTQVALIHKYQRTLTCSREQ